MMLPLWCFGCHVDFFLDVDLRSGGGMHLKDVVFFGDFFRDCLRVFFFWRISVFQNLHGSSFSEFTNCLG